MSAPVPIVLPPEPPRDRVIEALDGDGTVVRRWKFEKTTWAEYLFGAGRWWQWEGIVGHAMSKGWSLQSVATGEQ